MAGRDFIIFVIRRLINAIITLFLVLLLMFVLVHVVYPTPPLSLARLYAGPHPPTYAQLEAIVKEYDLNAPIYIQFLNYLNDIFHGNLGFDPVNKVPAAEEIMYYLPITLTYIIPATVITVLMGTYLAWPRQPTGISGSITLLGRFTYLPGRHPPRTSSPYYYN